MSIEEASYAPTMTAVCARDIMPPSILRVMPSAAATDHTVFQVAEAHGLRLIQGQALMADAQLRDLYDRIGTHLRIEPAETAFERGLTEGHHAGYTEGYEDGYSKGAEAIANDYRMEGRYAA